MPAVSVILPVYNRGHLIAEAIQSVLKQTFQDFELIVVNDGSQDNTEEAVLAFQDPRLKYYKHENRGASAARNTGLAAASADLIAFLDSDDLFLSERLALQVAKFAEEPGLGLLYGKYYATSSNESKARLAGVCYPELGLRQLLMGTAFHWSTAIIRRSWLERSGGFDEQIRVGVEWDLLLRLALAGCPMGCIPRPLAFVRIQPVSITRQAQVHDPGAIKVLDKIFSDPRLPDEMRELRDQAYAMGLVRGTRMAYLGPNPELGKQMLQEALAIYPPLANQKVDLVAEKLLNHVTGFSLRDPEEALGIILQHLPDDRKFSKKLGSELLGRFYKQKAFDALASGEPGECRRYLVKACLHQPAVLRDRGAISVLLRSMLGDRIFEQVLGSGKRTHPSMTGESN